MHTAALACRNEFGIYRLRWVQEWMAWFMSAGEASGMKQELLVDSKVCEFAG
jgi:hypothetical protein